MPHPYHVGYSGNRGLPPVAPAPRPWSSHHAVGGWLPKLSATGRGMMRELIWKLAIEPSPHYLHHHAEGGKHTDLAPIRAPAVCIHSILTTLQRTTLSKELNKLRLGEVQLPAYMSHSKCE